MSDITVPAAPVTAWRPIPTERRTPDRSTEFTAGPPALTIALYTNGGYERARGLLTVAAAKHFEQMGTPYVLVEYGEDEHGGLLRLVGLEAKVNPLAMKIGRDSTVVGSQLKRLAPEGKARYELVKMGESLVARIPEPIMVGLREAAA